MSRPYPTRIFRLFFKRLLPISELISERIYLCLNLQKNSVTPNYLGMLFSKRMGVSFSDYLNTVRLRVACNLLAQTELSVKEIAFASGYNSFEHFEYTFKKTFLLTTPIQTGKQGHIRLRLMYALY